MSDQTLELPTKHRKITAHDVLAIADLMAKRITETGACLMLKIKPDSWFQWKRRAKNISKFEQILTRIRESKLNSCIASIDEAGESCLIQTEDGEKTYTKRGDWRAKAWLAERVLAPERLGDKQADQSAHVTVNILSTEAMAKIEASFKSQHVAITNGHKPLELEHHKTIDTIEQK